MPDGQTLPFRMHGAREVLEFGSAHFEEQITALEEAVEKNPGLAFDLAKTLLESTCKAMLKERGTEVDPGWDLPKLLKETVIRLRLIPEGVEEDGQVSNSLRKTVGGLQTVIHGISELRNSHGFASHGKDPSFQQLDAVQALLVARSADAIVSFLFRVHRAYPETGASRPINYGDYPDFDNYVDEANEIVRIFKMEYRPSEVLFEVDPQAYRSYLTDWGAEEEDDDDEDVKEAETSGNGG